MIGFLGFVCAVYCCYSYCGCCVAFRLLFTVLLVTCCLRLLLDCFDWLGVLLFWFTWLIMLLWVVCLLFCIILFLFTYVVIVCWDCGFRFVLFISLGFTNMF